jgi:hypothetical protein
MAVTLGRQLKAGQILLDAKLPKIAQVLRRSVDALRRAEADRPNTRLVALAMRDLLSRNGVESSWMACGLRRGGRRRGRLWRATLSDSGPRGRCCNISRGKMC